jgi:superoxide dismutase, Fe-Mn family
MKENTSPLTRRQAVKLFATATAAVSLGNSLVSAAPAAAPRGGAAGLPAQIPPLPYKYDALEPHIDAQTMEIHHGKHHASYLAAARKLLEPHAALQARRSEDLLANLEQVPSDIRTGLRNQLGGHVNHVFFWEIMAPAKSYRAGRLQEAIGQSFGSVDAFKQQFTQAAMGRFGSGWAWLSQKRDGSLTIHSTANQDSPLMEGLTPIIGLDVWEHAYYLRRQNRRAEYVEAFWNVLNWDRAEELYRSARA